MIKICFITASRSDYGILKNLIILAKNSKLFRTDIIATGSHLSHLLGKTANEIKKDKIKIKHKIKLNESKSDSHKIILNQSSELIKKLSKKIELVKPDIIIILGDRFEILFSAYTAFLMNIPIAHIHGGEITIGSIDNAFRYSISKMSNLHFVATKKSKERLIKNEIDKKKIFHVGSPSITSVKDINFKSKKNLQHIFKFKFLNKNIIVTFHPTTKEKTNYKSQINNFLGALEKLRNVGIIFTKPSNDIGNKYFIDKIKVFVKKHKNSILISSLGRENYFSCLKIANAVVGNSSSGIIEAPSIGCPTLNIGERQKDREQAKSIINSSYNKKKIYKKLIFLLKRKKKKIYTNPYLKKNTNRKIINLIKIYFKKKNERNYLNK